MGPAFEAALEEGLAQLGLLDSPAAAPRARRSYEAHARLLRAWGSVINLTAIREEGEVARRHVCDSLSAVTPLAGIVGPGDMLLDLGSGGGYPGLPLAGALPLGRVALLDSVAKKARFLAVAAAAVAEALNEADDGHERATVPAISAVPGRAEDLAGDPDMRASWHIVTARAVGALAEVIELAMPLARDGGHVVAWKRDGPGKTLRHELREAGSIIRASGGGRPAVVDLGVPLLPDHRLVIVPKLRPTPATYPRPAGRRRSRQGAGRP